VNKMVHTYGVKYEFNSATAVNSTTDVIDLGVTPPAAGTAVTLVPVSGGTLPEGLFEDEIYYVRTVSGTTCMLSHQNNDTTVADITSGGTGTTCMLTGYGSGSATMNVLEDVTGDLWSVGDAVALIDSAPENYDQQRVTLAAISAATITLSSAVDSVQYAGARLAIASRNVEITSLCTTNINIVDFKTATFTGAVLQCGILSRSGTGSTFYGNGLRDGTGHTVSGSVFGCTYGLYSGTGHTVSGSVFGCSNGLRDGTGHTVSGSVYNNAADFRYPLTATMLSGSQSTFVFASQNTVGTPGRIPCENFNGVAGAHKTFDAFGDVIKTACDGASGAPSAGPSGAEGDCIEVSNIQSNCDTVNYLSIIPRHRLWLTAGSHTITYSVQSSFTVIPAGRLKLVINYISAVSPLVNTNVSDSPEISQRASDTDWAQTLSATFTAAADGWVDCKIDLMHYESGAVVYVWPTPTVSN
jgi:hypothetical protein